MIPESKALKWQAQPSLIQHEDYREIAETLVALWKVARWLEYEKAIHLVSATESGKVLESLNPEIPMPMKPQPAEILNEWDT